MSWQWKFRRVDFRPTICLWGEHPPSGMQVMEVKGGTMKVNPVISKEQYWLAMVVWAVIAFLVFQSVAVAADRDIASGKHYQIWYQARECELYRSVLKRAQLAVVEERQNLEDFMAVAKESREQLDRCAKEHGIRGAGSQDVELMTAQYCPDNYMTWLSRGYSVEMARQDLSSFRTEEDRLTGFIRHSCSHVILARTP